MIGKRIRELRIKKGLSLNQLADRATVAKSYLSYIERGLQKNPSVQFLQKVSEVLEVDIETLVGEVGHVPEDEEKLDDEWIELAREAVKAGINKKQMSEYKEFVEFMKWKNHKRTRNI